MPYVYFIQPVELVGTNRYKIGMSRLDNLSRLRSYKVGTRYIAMFDCDDARLVERSLIAAFNKDFNRIGGNEYFEIPDESKAVHLFVAIVMNNKARRSSEPSEPSEPSSMPTEDESCTVTEHLTEWTKRFSFARV
jgi:hypothetical protein